jgi:predicted ATP-dependent endonuclease of OLD family
MITRIEINNYRSCTNCSFDLQPNLSVLIGPNGSGKTNILNALLLLRKLAEEELYYSYKREDEEATGKSKIKIYFKIDNKKVILTATIGTYTDENNNDIVVVSNQHWYMKDFTGDAKRLNFPLSLWTIGHENNDSFVYNRRAYITRSRFYDKISEKASDIIVKIGKYAHGMRYYSASQFTNPGLCPISFEIEKEGSKSRGLRLRGHAKFLYDLYTAFKTNSKNYKEFFGIIGPDGIGLVDNIDFEEMVTSSVEYSVRSGGTVRKKTREKSLVIPQFIIGKHILSPNQLSEGTFKTITLLFYLITESSSMLLLEEPEVCVHHGLLSSIIELVKSYSSGKQIVLSTHSDFVLDHLLPEHVYKVTNKKKDGTVIKHIPNSMPRKELAALKEYLETEGNLGEYWKHGALE